MKVSEYFTNEFVQTTKDKGPESYIGELIHTLSGRFKPAPEGTIFKISPGKMSWTCDFDGAEYGAWCHVDTEDSALVARVKTSLERQARDSYAAYIVGKLFPTDSEKWHARWRG